MGQREKRTYHLTPTGWVSDDESAPADRVLTMTFYEPEHMYGRGYWEDDWKSGDKTEIETLKKKYGRKPPLLKV